MDVGGTRVLSGWPSTLKIKIICTKQQVLGVLVRKPNKGFTIVWYAHTVCLWVKSQRKENRRKDIARATNMRADLELLRCMHLKVLATHTGHMMRHVT